MEMTSTRNVPARWRRCGRRSTILRCSRMHSRLRGHRARRGECLPDRAGRAHRAGRGEIHRAGCSSADIDPPNGYTLSFEGQGGAAGFAKGDAKVSLAPAENGAATTLSYIVNAQVGGKIAQIGSRLVDGAAQKLADDFFARFSEAVAATAGLAPRAAAPALAGKRPWVRYVASRSWWALSPISRRAGQDRSRGGGVEPRAGGTMDSVDLEVLKRCADWLYAGRRVLLVTVVKTWGSSPRPPGAMLAVRDDGSSRARFPAAASRTTSSDGCARWHDRAGMRRRDLRRVGGRGAALRLAVRGHDPARAGAAEQRSGIRELLAATEGGRLVARRLDLATGAASLAPARASDGLTFDGSVLTTVHGPRYRMLVIGASQLSNISRRWRSASTIR